MEDENVCRICRGEAAPDEPLFHPCRCAGSIRYVHQDCLMEWLNHAGKGAKCELCGTPYTFQNIYKDDMPARLPLKAYAYKLYITYFHILGKINIIVRAIVMTALMSIVVKYAFEFSTLLAENLRTSPFSIQPTVTELHHRLLSRRTAHFKYLAMEFETWWIQELYTAIMDGFILFVVMLFVAFILYLATVWALNEQTLLHDLEHLARGEPGHMDLPEEMAEALDRNHDPAANRFNARLEQAQADLLQQAQAALAQQAQDAGANIDLDILRAPRVQPLVPRAQPLEEPIIPPPPAIDDDDDIFAPFEDDDMDIFDEGENVWTFIEGVFGGPILMKIGWFAAFGGATIIVIFSLFQGPFSFGRYSLESSIYLTELSIAYVQTRWPQYTPTALSDFARIPNKIQILSVSPEFHAFTYWVGCMTIFLSVHLVYSLYFHALLKTPSGRTALMFLKQFLAIGKVLGVVVIELMIFPLFCGHLLHIAVVPLMVYSDFATAVSVTLNHPWLMIFVHWGIGLAYMYMLAGFLRICRTFLRPGVLYFVQDPSDPRNEPIKTILKDGWIRHMKKIGISALIYSGLLLGGIGGISLPLRLTTTVPGLIPALELTKIPGPEIFRLWPLPFVIYTIFSTGQVSRQQVLTYLERLWKAETLRSAQALDLDSWMFKIPRKAPVTDDGGYFVRAPMIDSFVTRRKLKLFVPVTADDKRLDGLEGTLPNELRKYTVVWRPSFFKFRIILHMLWLWVTGVRLTLLGTLLPLMAGRLFNQALMGGCLTNDIVIYITGLTIVTSAFSVVRGLYWFTPTRETIIEECKKALLIASTGSLVGRVLASPHTPLKYIEPFVRPSDFFLVSWMLYGTILRGLGSAIGPMNLGHLVLLMLISPFSAPLDVAAAFVSIGFIVVASFKWLSSQFSLKLRFTLWLRSAREDFYLVGRQLQNLPSND